MEDLKVNHDIISMYKGIRATLIWSGDYKKLAKWYQEKFGFKVIKEIKHPDDTGIMLAVGKSKLWIGKHSKVKGKSKDPYRMMFNIEVNSVLKAYKLLSGMGVKFIAEPFKAPTFDKHFATFEDLDGNIGQIVGNL